MQFECPKCKRVNFCNPVQLVHHYHTHRNEHNVKFTCPFCNRKCNSYGSLKTHFYREHTNKLKNFSRSTSDTITFIKCKESKSLRFLIRPQFL